MNKLSIGACAALFALAAGCGAADIDGRGGAITVGGSEQGTLSSLDPIMTVPGRSATTQYATDVWTVNLTMGEAVSIAMCENAGSDFDPYLSVENAAAMDVDHTNDDTGGGYHGHGSLVVLTPTATGEYTIYASTYRTVTGDTHGDYTLSVMAGDMSGSFHCPGN